MWIFLQISNFMQIAPIVCLKIQFQVEAGILQIQLSKQFNNTDNANKHL